jgi:hypothetical protein
VATNRTVGAVGADHVFGAQGRRLIAVAKRHGDAVVILVDRDQLGAEPHRGARQ